MRTVEGKIKFRLGEYTQTILVCIFAFFSVLLFQFIFVFQNANMRDINTEYNILSLGSFYYGYNWMATTTDVAYSGVSFIPFICLFYKLGVGGATVYRLLRWISAIMLSVPAAIASTIAKRIYRLDNRVSYAVGVLVCVFSPIRATSISGDIFAVFYIWVIIACSFGAFFSYRSWSKILLSVIAGILTVMLIMTDIKTVALIPAFLFALIVIRIKRFKVGIEIYCYILSFLIVIPLAVKGMDYLLSTFSLGYEWGTDVYGIISSSIDSFRESVFNLFTEYGIRAFFDLFLSNLWVIIIDSSGLIIVGAIYTYKFVFSKDFQRIKAPITTLTLMTALFFSLVQTAITYINSAIDLHSNNASANHFYFYLDYCGYLITPALFLSIMILFKLNKNRKVLYLTEAVIILSSLYIIMSVVMPSIKNSNTAMKWWLGYTTPFLLNLNQWADKDTFVWFFIFPALIVGFLIYCYSESRDFNTAVYLLVLASVVQYSYIELYWKDKTDYKDSFNTCSEYLYNNQLTNEYYDHFIYLGDLNIARYLQMENADKVIEVSLPDEYDDSQLCILTPRQAINIDNRYKLDDYVFTRLDGNETLIFNNLSLADYMHSEGRAVIDSGSKCELYINDIYNAVFGRNADAGAYLTWDKGIASGELSPREFVLILLDSEEFKSKDLNSKKVIEIMARAYWGAGIDKKEVIRLNRFLRTDGTIEDIADYFVGEEQYYLRCRRFDIDSPRIPLMSSIMNRAYRICLNRNLVGEEMSMRLDETRYSSWNINNFYSSIIYSQEFETKHTDNHDIVRILYLLYTNQMPTTSELNSICVLLEKGEITYDNLLSALRGTIAYNIMIDEYNMSKYVMGIEKA